MGDRQNSDHLTAFTIACYQDDRTWAIFDALLLSAQIFSLPEIGIAYDKTWNSCGECHPN